MDDSSCGCKFNVKCNRKASFKCLTSHILSPSVLPWDRFSQWVYCICVVTFDLELGQALELMYPSHVKLTEKEKTSICYMAFPDSNSGCMGDTQFFFRFRQCPVRRVSIQAHEDYNKMCPATLSIEPSHFYGFVYFRQVKDKTIRRGYFQKLLQSDLKLESSLEYCWSMVLLTRLPLTTFFTRILSIIAPLYFCEQEPSLETACHDIDQWPLPEPGVLLNLPLMGVVVQIRIPSKFDKATITPRTESPVLQHTALSESEIVPSVHEPNIFKCFLPVLSHIQLLWELVITGEPIVVMAASPTVCSNMVQALVSMIWPLRYCSDYRPYFTIHDSEFKEYTSSVQATPPVILGVTNPFFAKTLQHWPHIIRIGDLQESTSSSNDKQKLKRAGNLKTLDSKPGLYTRYKSYLNKDKNILKKLMKGVQTQRPNEVQNAILKHYLLEVTQSFMIPLERYMASLMPLQRNISPHKGAPIPRPFNPDDFLKSTEQAGPQLTTGVKGNWNALYRKFFRSANFSGWYNARYKEVVHKLQALHIEAISDANLLDWIQDKQEVEIVDLVLRLREKVMVAENERLSLDPKTLEKLQSHMNSIISTLPDDLQNLLK